MLASKAGRTPMSTPGGVKSREENIFVTVRVRPLSQKEQASKDQVAWECMDDHTLAYMNSYKRSTTSYTYDRIFGPTCVTEMVYQEGAKDVALSALTGINATIFAYGQTNSGKTFTMKGITESTINDIYGYIQNTPERDFFIKMSAMEIYNETVTDLLNPESGPLRLWDDPEKGTIIEKLMEEKAKDSQHLRHLIGICEAQRQVSETSLNDASSRSHQIIRLIVESSPLESSGGIKSLIATLNFVDLAGSERTSQTNVYSRRLKEGCHINLSLLTLTTVIRKLSARKRSGHIPYRDSKLTRILQHSLGGNARTAIICTMSPVLSHAEQSRNTLAFANHAKEVTNSARVNMIVPEKQLVKHLKKEVARLEAELGTPERSSTSRSVALLREKEYRIHKMETEMEELKHQRDHALSELDELRKNVQQEHQVVKFPSFSRNLGDRTKTTVRRRKIFRQSSIAPISLIHEIRKLEQLQNRLGEEANRALQVLHKEVAFHRMGNQDAAETITKLLTGIKETRSINCLAADVEVKDSSTDHGGAADLKEEITRLNSHEYAIATLEEQLEHAQKCIDKLVMSLPNYDGASQSTSPSRKKKKRSPLALSNNIKTEEPCAHVPSSQQVELEPENKPPQNCELPPLASNETPTKDVDSGGVISSRDSTPGYHRPPTINVKKMQKMFENALEENIRSIRAYVTELKERVAKLQYQKQLLVCQVLELEANEASVNEDEEPIENPPPWDQVFDEKKKQIILLWHLCHISVIRRSRFYLLFKGGDPSEQIYIEVELRRLIWLEDHFAQLGNASPALLGDDPPISVYSSIRALKQEREALARRVNSRFTVAERENLYIKWEIPLDGKQRRVQLVNKLWMDPHNMQHVQESADIVARLVGFYEPGSRVSKEMFELNFAILPDKRKPSLLERSPISNLLHL
ncbi:Kinesin-like protein NACK1 [Acorus calamus]|uniref:Kinesin-like protein n=1 Tax=Acorus calamus TaxID=4465 RepID=A0AAV9E3C7_ACOCL|nr:Kinesin-like protein NACK1 [Acorus calamus]